MDNQSTLAICSNVENYDGAIRYAKKSNKIAEVVENYKFTIEYVPTEINVADIFTNFTAFWKIKGATWGEISPLWLCK